MQPFAYSAPTTIKEAVEILDKHGDKARPLAGGTDLLVPVSYTHLTLPRRS